MEFFHTTKFKKMSRITVLIYLSLVVLTACRNMKMNHNKIHGVHVTSISPIILEDGSIINLNGFLNVYTYKDLIMYESSYHYDSTVDEKLIFEEYRYQYFIYHKDSL